MTLRQKPLREDDFPGAEKVVEVFGVRYAHLQTGEGDLYLTRFGWPHRNCLAPENWRYSPKDEEITHTRLQGSSTVWRVKTKPVDGKSLDMVLKWNRVGQEMIDVEFSGKKWASPWEEFGHVMQVREDDYGDASIRIYTQRPLAIFTPAKKINPSQLGRQKHILRTKIMAVQRDQAGRTEADSVDLDPNKNYAVLYGWVKGVTAYELKEDLGWSNEQIMEVTSEAERVMEDKGWVTADSKPQHIVLRVKDGKPLRRRDGRLVFATIDYELLGETDGHKAQRVAERKNEYYRHVARMWDSSQPDALPANLRLIETPGLSLLWGRSDSPDCFMGIVGRNQHVFDFFRPERWYYDPEERMSEDLDLYHKRTKDGLHIVVQYSRWGQDPQQAYPGRIRESIAFNDPLTEIKIAEDLRSKGVHTVYPRALMLRDVELGEEVFQAGRIDARSIQPGQADLIWGYWKGVDPLEGYRAKGIWAYVDLEWAKNLGAITPDSYDEMLKHARQYVNGWGLPGDEFAAYQFFLTFREDSTFEVTSDGRPLIQLGLDNFKAASCSLISGEQLSQLSRRETDKIRKAGYMDENPYGNHMILTVDLDGNFRLEEDGLPFATHCMFDLFKPIHRQMELF